MGKSIKNAAAKPSPSAFAATAAPLTGYKGATAVTQSKVDAPNTNLQKVAVQLQLIPKQILRID